MHDWLGLFFFVVLAAGISMNALQGLMNPEAAKAKEVITQMKEGRYQKKKREGKVVVLTLIRKLGKPRPTI